MTILSTPAKTKGLARNKILAIMGIMLLIMLSALLFGVLTPKEDYRPDENLVIYRDDAKSVEQLLQEADALQLTTAESVIISASKQVALQMVPPISLARVEVTKTAQDMVLKQAEESQVLAKTGNKYLGAGVKSLLYSNTPGINQHSATVPSVESVSKPLVPSLVEAQSPYEVKAGSVIPAIMINGLNSDLAGQVVAQVRENVYDSSTRKYLLIPQGAKLVGVYNNNITYGQERILVAWNRLIYQNGSSISLNAMPGTDLEGYAGFYDVVDNKYWKIFGNSFVMGVITAAMQYSQNNTNSQIISSGTTGNNPTVGQTLSSSLGQQLGQTGLAITQKNLNVQPTLIIKPNYPFNIMLTADMVLRPLPAPLARK